MEINPGDYTAQYLTIRFLRRWFFILVVWRTAGLIIPHVWSTARGSTVMIEFFWTWLRRQLHFASHFQDFFLMLLFLFLILRWQKIDHIKPCLSSFSNPWGASAAESPRDNKGKDIKAHKQHTHSQACAHTHAHTARRKESEGVCLWMCLQEFSLIYVYAVDWELKSSLPAAVRGELVVSPFCFLVAEIHTCPQILTTTSLHPLHLDREDQSFAGCLLPAASKRVLSQRGVKPEYNQLPSYDRRAPWQLLCSFFAPL